MRTQAVAAQARRTPPVDIQAMRDKSKMAKSIFASTIDVVLSDIVLTTPFLS